MYKIIVSKKVEKELNRINEEFKERITKILLQLSMSPYLGKPLKGEFEGLYSIKVWPYRIIYEIYKKQLLIYIVHIAHRQNAYK